MLHFTPWLSLVGCFLMWVEPSHANGRLWDPPGRSTMWKRGFSVPPNYEDMDITCGGLAYRQNLDGLCGVCGDPWDKERPNEAGGRFATGQISRAYRKGDTITVSVDLTANHKGFFEFKLCPVNSASKKATQDCFDQNVLELASLSNRATRYPITFDMGSGMIDIDLKLPPSITCSQCVLQWRYHAGNSWGKNEDDGQSCVGCGPQEEYYACADIQIVDYGRPVPKTILGDPNSGWAFFGRASSSKISGAGASSGSPKLLGLVLVSVHLLGLVLVSA